MSKPFLDGLEAKGSNDDRFGWIFFELMISLADWGSMENSEATVGHEARGVVLRSPKGAAGEVAPLPRDALFHDKSARAIIGHIAELPVGATIAIQGSWGRGKTDVLRRVFEFASSENDKGGPEPLWLNPWAYGSPDLLRPLVAQLCGAIPQKRDHPTLKRAVTTLLRAGNAIAFKGLSVVAPLGGVMSAAEGPVDDFLAHLFDQRDAMAQETDPDPVESMALRFRELVDLYIDAKPDSRVIVCIDDIDRCLPDHQIAMLEAIHFLTSAQARVSFIIAVDPKLVTEAAYAHYGSASFDIDQYLDKVFDLRINLHSVSPKDVVMLVRGWLDDRSSRDSRGKRSDVGDVIRRGVGITTAGLVEEFEKIAYLPELCNPRLIGRVVGRCHLLACERLRIDDPLMLSAPNSRRATIMWLVIAERWPGVRNVVQLAEHPFVDADVLKAIVEYYHDVHWGKELPHLATNIKSRIPSPERNPDVAQFFSDHLWTSVPNEELAEIEEALTSASL